MLYFLLALPLGIVFVAFQSTVLNTITIAGGHPDLITVSLVLFAIYANYDFALVMAIITGPLIDSVSGLPLGVSIIPLVAVVLLARGWGRAIFGSRLGWPIFVIFISILVSGFITIAELNVIGWRFSWQTFLLDTLFPTAFLNALLALTFYLPMILFNERRELHLG